MSQVWAALDASWRVLIVGLIFGAGLPTLFALGIRAMAWGTGGDAAIHAEGFAPKQHPLGRVIGYVLFALVISLVVLGISYIVAHGLGYTLGFQGMLPVFTQRS